VASTRQAALSAFESLTDEDSFVPDELENALSEIAEDVLTAWG
jgi:hypothetical protein